MADNVVDLNSRRQQQDPIMELPQPVLDKLAEIKEKTELLVKELDETMLGFADTHGAPIDVSIPLEALAINIAQVSADLDAQVLPEVREQHIQIRISLAQEINKTVQQFAGQQGTPVYSQDIYIGMMHALVSYIQQHRIYGQLKTYSQTEQQGDQNE